VNLLSTQNVTLLSGVSGLSAITITLTSAIGSLILGVGSKALALKPLLEVPSTSIQIPIRYTMPPRYGYIDGANKRSFNVNTSGNQITYVILNTATNLFSLKINEFAVLSAYNQFRSAANLLSTSYIGITGVTNFQTSTKVLSQEKQTGLTATNLSAYDIKYFYTPNKIVLGVISRAPLSATVVIPEPIDMYDSYLIHTTFTEPVLTGTTTQLPPPAAL
jgi:hypothetical protein